jgi:hypothetical protein
MLRTMQTVVYAGSKKPLPYLAGVLFCGLLVAFAVASKAAAYYPHDAGTRPITATKIWQQQDPAAKCVIQTTPTFPPVSFFVLAFAILAVIVRFMAWMQTASAFSPAFELCYGRAHAIRPPPRG